MWRYIIYMQMNSYIHLYLQLFVKFLQHFLRILETLESFPLIKCKVMTLGGGADIPLIHREAEKNFFPRLDPQIWGTASYLNSFSTWQKGESPLKWCGRQLSCVLLSILYGYPWPPGASTTSGFTFLFLQLGANSLNVQKTSVLDNVKSQKSPREREKRGRGDLSVFLTQP